LRDPAGPVGDEAGCHEEDRIPRIYCQGRTFQLCGGTRVAEPEIRERGVVVQRLWPGAGSRRDLRDPVKRVGVIFHRGVQVPRFAFMVPELLTRVVRDSREQEPRIEGVLRVRRFLVRVALRCQQVERAERLYRLRDAAGREQCRAPVEFRLIDIQIVVVAHEAPAARRKTEFGCCVVVLVGQEVDLSQAERGQGAAVCPSRLPVQGELLGSGEIPGPAQQVLPAVSDVVAGDAVALHDALVGFAAGFRFGHQHQLGRQGTGHCGGPEALKLRRPVRRGRRGVPEEQLVPGQGP
jgi:hypothetical protein